MHRIFAVALGASLFGCGPAHVHHAHYERFGADFARYARDMNAGMEKMMHGMHAPGYTGDPDTDFLAMMIPHHEGAVEMARLVLIHGRDPLVRALAAEIIAGQTVEIDAMRARLAILAKGRDVNPDGFPALGSTRGPVQ